MAQVNSAAQGTQGHLLAVKGFLPPVAANLPGMSNSRQSRPDGSAVAGVTP